MNNITRCFQLSFTTFQQRSTNTNLSTSAVKRANLPSSYISSDIFGLLHLPMFEIHANNRDPWINSNPTLILPPPPHHRFFSAPTLSLATRPPPPLLSSLAAEPCSPSHACCTARERPLASHVAVVASCCYCVAALRHAHAGEEAPPPCRRRSLPTCLPSTSCVVVPPRAIEPPCSSCRCIAHRRRGLRSRVAVVPAPNNKPFSSEGDGYSTLQLFFNV